MKILFTGRWRPVFLLCLMFFISTMSLARESVELEQRSLSLQGESIVVEVADTEFSRSVGLMYREYLPANEGMLFVFKHPTQPCFWMKNTLIPLSIAFITAAGNISSIHSMQPHSTALHCPTEPILYALEMNEGWFAEHGIGTGTAIDHLP